jgi:hypothetical protein
MEQMDRAMSHDEFDYYQRRAEAEIELAQKSAHTDVVQAHYQMATAYLDRIYAPSPED